MTESIKNLHKPVMHNSCHFWLDRPYGGGASISPMRQSPRLPNRVEQVAQW